MMDASPFSLLPVLLLDLPLPVLGSTDNYALILPFSTLE